MEPRYRQPKSTIALNDHCRTLDVVESPMEVMAKITSISAAGHSLDSFIELTCGNQDEWNGKPTFVKIRAIDIVMPPSSVDDDQ